MPIFFIKKKSISTFTDKYAIKTGYTIFKYIVMVMTVYNMKRCIYILGFDELMTKLKAWKPKYKKTWACFAKTGQNTSLIRALFFEYRIAA